MELADGWTRVAGRRRKSPVKKMGNSRIIEHKPSVMGTTSGSKVSPLSDQLDTAETSAAAAVDNQTESPSVELSSGHYAGSHRPYSHHTTMPGWYLENGVIETSKQGRNRKSGRQLMPRTAEEEVGRIIVRLEQARSVKLMKMSTRG